MKHLYIKQNNNVEIVSSDIIEKLYQISQGGLDSTSDLIGNLQCTHAYDDAVTYLTTKFKNLQINVTDRKYIRFADKEVEKICAANWGDGTGITAVQAAAVSSIGTVFQNNTEIKSFNELMYFKNINDLESSFYNSSIEYVKIPVKFTSISNNAFYRCRKLMSFDFLNIETVERYAFCEDPSLNTIVNVNELQKISDSSFSGCENLKIDINMRNLNIIESDAFRASGIISISDLGNVTSLGTVTSVYAAFCGCRNLKSIVLSDKIQVIGNWCFRSSDNIKSMVIKATVPPSLGSQALAEGINAIPNYFIYVPDDSVSLYKTATDWIFCASRIKPLSEFSTDFPNG